MAVRSARGARQPRLVGGIAGSAGGGADQCCVRTSAARCRDRGRAVQRFVKREPIAVGGIQPRALLEPFTLALLRAPPRFGRPFADFSRLRPVRNRLDGCTQVKPGKIGGDLRTLGLSERLAERAEPGALAHAASRTSGSVMPSGSTVLLARAM